MVGDVFCSVLPRQRACATWHTVWVKCACASVVLLHMRRVSPSQLRRPPLPLGGTCHSPLSPLSPTPPTNSSPPAPCPQTGPDEVITLTGPRGRITRLHWVDGNRHLLSSSEDGMVRTSCLCHAA